MYNYWCFSNFKGSPLLLREKSLYEWNGENSCGLQPTVIWGYKQLVIDENAQWVFKLPQNPINGLCVHVWIALRTISRARLNTHYLAYLTMKSLCWEWVGPVDFFLCRKDHVVGHRTLGFSVFSIHPIATVHKPSWGLSDLSMRYYGYLHLVCEQ